MAGAGALQEKLPGACAWWGEPRESRPPTLHPQEATAGGSRQPCDCLP